MHCTTCDQELPEDANYCLRCGTPQKAWLRPAFRPYRKLAWRQYALVYPAAVGMIFLAILVLGAYQLRWEPLSEPTWWLALLGVLALILVPQLVFRLIWRNEDQRSQ